jgi:hypothetical protein
MRGLILLTGILSFLGALVLLWVGGSLFASFRSEHILGPGVDVILLSKFPLEGENIDLEITARGGSAAGMNEVYAYDIEEGSVPVASTQGQGVTWGYTVSSRSRGQATVELPVPQDAVTHHGHAVFSLEVNYVCAMSSSGGFTNNRMQDVVYVDVPIYTPAQKLRAQLLDLLLALAGLFLWGWLWYAIWKRAEDRKREPLDAATEKDVAYAGMGIFLGGCIIGYWIFARFLGSAFSINNGGFTALLVLVWISAVAVAWRRAKKKLRTEELH